MENAIAQDDLLRMEGIEKLFPGVHALNNCRFEIRRGEVHALVGENGAGKSTMMKVLTGIYKRDGGTIHYKGREIDLSSPEEAQALAKPIIKPETSAKMRYLLRLNAEKGSAKKVNVPGFYAGGKTGTAEKVIGGRYSKTKLLTTFTGIFPMDNPQYLVLVILDEPQAVEGTYGYATAGWNAAPTTGKIISRIGPMLGIMPRTDLPSPESLLANTTLARAP